MRCQPRSATGKHAPVSTVDRAGNTPDVGVVMSYKAAAAIHCLCGLGTSLAEIVDEREERGQGRSEVGHLCRPVVHLCVDVDGVLAVPRCEAFLVPDALQIGSLTAGA